jgi:small subunit ribosomal protein S3
MGQKVNPISMRLALNKNWKSKWVVSGRSFSKYLIQDGKARKAIEKRFENQAVVDRISIERSPNLNSVTISTSRPGMVIGKGGSTVDEIKLELDKIFDKKGTRINVEEIKRPELHTKLVGEGIARQLKARAAFKRVMKATVQSTMRAGAKGVKVQLSGRLGGAEMSRTEKEQDGSVPLHTLRADIDYALTELYTPAGIIGIKVWINKGEI